VCPRPVEHLLPWQVDSRPPGARVTIPDGRIRRTPFTNQSGLGERVQLTFELAGHQTREVVLTSPRDLMIDLHRFPEREWINEYRVEAVPVPVADDHIVADRFGRLRRIDRDGNARWECTLRTLGGIARTPMFLPPMPGSLLVLSEDGRAWLVNASDGEVDGPREVGSALVEGPTLTRGGVSARFADGRVALWTNRLEPSFYAVDGLVRTESGDSEEELAHRSKMVVLRRGLDKDTRLVSPWTQWSVSVRDDEFRIQGPDGRGFTAERAGEWVFVSWEAPKALMPIGRVWVSDEKGLRSYLPDSDQLVSYDD
jgi:hypothetical protein